MARINPPVTIAHLGYNLYGIYCDGTAIATGLRDWEAEDIATALNMLPVAQEMIEIIKELGWEHYNDIAEKYDEVLSSSKVY